VNKLSVYVQHNLPDSFPGESVDQMIRVSGQEIKKGCR